MADHDVEVEVGAKIEQLSEGVEAAKKAIESIKESADRATEGLRSVFEIAGIALSIEGIKSFVESMGELGLQTERTMATLGISSESVGQLAGTAKLSGTSMEGLSLAIERMSLNIQRSTRDATNPAAQGLQALGLRAKELIGLPADQYFGKLAEAISKFNPSLNLTNALMSVGGRGVQQLLPMLVEGKEHFEELQKAVQETGATLTDAQTHAFAQTHEKLTLMGMAVQGVGIKIFDILYPAVQKAADGVRLWLQEIKPETLRDGLNSIGMALIDIAANIAKFFVNVKAVWDELIASISAAPLVRLFSIISEAGERASANARAQVDTFKGMIGVTVTAGSATQKIFDDIAKRADEGRAKIDEMAASMRAAFSAAVPKSGTWDAQLAGIKLFAQEMDAVWEKFSKKEVKPIDFGAKDTAGGAMKDIEAQIDAAKAKYEELKITEKSAVDTFRETESEKVAHLKAALAQREADIVALYDKEKALAGGSATQIADIEKRKQAAIAEIKKEAATLDAELAKKNVDEWNSALSGLTSAFNSQLKGLLAGTTTWAQAMKTITGDLVIKMIEEFEKLAVVKPLASIAGSMLSAPSDMFAGLIKLVTSLFGPLSAGFTTFFAPTLGPAAPAAGAAAAGAEVAAAAGTLGGFEVGTDYVPRTGAYILHQGEAVTPAAQNPAAGGSGGGSVPNITFQVSAIDAGSVQKFFSQYGPQIARVLSDHMNTNPSFAG
jgi:hypothetical protein